MLTFEYTASGHGVAEQVELAEDGGVVRLVARAGGAQPALGWWTGAIDPASLAAAAQLAGAEWPTGPSSRPPAAGGWTVRGARGRLGLWDGADAVTTGLNVVLSTCREAATDADVVAQMAVRPAAGPEPGTLLTISSTGANEVHVELDEEVSTGVVAFVTDEGETLGFAGSEMWVPAGVAVHGVIRDPGAAGDRLEVEGLLSGDDHDPVRVRAVVATGG